VPLFKGTFQYMILGKVSSKNGINIRLTKERWDHIILSHPEFDSKDFKGILRIVKYPAVILKGDIGELLAV
jgi:hypothetical protein